MCCTGAITRRPAPSPFGCLTISGTRSAVSSSDMPETGFAVIADDQDRRLVVEARCLSAARVGDRRVRLPSATCTKRKKRWPPAHLDPALGGIDRQRAVALERGLFVAVGRGELASKNEKPCDNPDCGAAGTTRPPRRS